MRQTVGRVVLRPANECQRDRLGPMKRITEPARSVDVILETEVLVVGSGPGGRAVWWRPATVRLCFPGSARAAPRCRLAVMLVVAQCPGPLAASAPHGSRPASRNQAGSLLLWSGFVRLDTDCPVSLATPADAARNPEHNTPIGETDPPNDVVGSVRTAPSCGAGC